ncbi:MAG: hypothetical protein PHC33_06520 [Candidatus Omnitrophica bacterium]|nr:hypothetical protein [Candidatus Omnitrophota bacterium]
MTGITFTSGKTLREFIRQYNSLPFAQPAFFSADKTEIYSELRKVRIFPDMYMGSVICKTGPYGKSEWMSEDGAFLEKQLKSMLKSLAEETARLLSVKE